MASKTEKKLEFDKFSACLPFYFYIKEFNSENRIFIYKYDSCYILYDKDIQNVIDKHLSIPVRRINKMDPFEYIQNWSKFRTLKNIHAQFSNRLWEIFSFSLMFHPLNYSDLVDNEYEFDDNEIYKISYKIKRPIKGNLKFNNFLKNIMKKDDIPGLNSYPDQIYYNFLNFKERKQQKFNKIFNAKVDKVDWNQDLSHIEKRKEIKCRVDNIKKVNVIFQNSFDFNNYTDVYGKIIKCVELFFSNDYPIIIIESNNEGGLVLLYSIFLQILQPRIEFRDYRSYRVTPTSEAYFNGLTLGRLIDTFDCSEINLFTDFNHFYEDSYGDKSIHHNRTSPFDPLDIRYRLALQELREKLLKNAKFIKRPTDILIFTDSFSFSATSGLIKGLQNTGGAITIGYLGNPKIKGVELFDASQSSSTVHNLTGTQIGKELKDKGFDIISVTVGESYNFHQKNNDKVQIPREYTLDPVDFRVNIFSIYYDGAYNKFIDEGLKIHKKLNQDGECNSKNDKLFLHDDNCYKIDGDIHAHGGYKCGSNNIWDKSKCEPYYCDIGYYFDQIQKKCIENCKIVNEKSIFIYEDNYHNTFELEKDIKYYFLFPFAAVRDYFYSYTENNQIKKKPVTSEGIFFYPENYARKVEIKEVKTNNNPNLININRKSIKLTFIKATDSLIFIESPENFVLYSDNIYKNSNTELQLAEYNSEMTYEEMLNHDSKYFNKFTDNIHIFTKDKIYLLYVKLPNLDPFNLFLNQIYEEETIEIKDLETEMLYLKKDKKYILDFKNNKINRMIKLSRETLKSEIVIENKNIIVSSSNLYYQIEDNYQGQLILYIKNENALIEFLFKQNDLDLEILDFEKMIFSLNKKYNILAIPKEYSSKVIDIELMRNEFLTNFTIYLAYAIPPYNFFSEDNEEDIFTMDEIFTFRINEHYKGVSNLMKDEYYCIMIENFGEDVTLTIEIKDEEKKENEGNSGLEDWKIALIVMIVLSLV